MFFFFCACAHERVHVHAMLHACGGHRTSYRNQFFPSNSVIRHLYPLSCFTGPLWEFFFPTEKQNDSSLEDKKDLVQQVCRWFEFPSCHTHSLWIKPLRTDSWTMESCVQDGFPPASPLRFSWDFTGVRTTMSSYSESWELNTVTHAWPLLPAAAPSQEVSYATASAQRREAAGRAEDFLGEKHSGRAHLWF